MALNNKWVAENIPDQTGKVAIVTGANSGIGYETTRTLAIKGAKVIMTCRNLEKGETARQTILGEHSKAQLKVMRLDLADLASVRSFADAFKAKYERLDVLVNNAGIMTVPYATTVDGFESQFGTNHLGHFALTGLLIDLVLNTPGARVVTVSSVGH